MPQQKPSTVPALDLSMFDQGASSGPATALDLSMFSEAPKDTRSVFAQAWDKGTTPLVSAETVRRVGGVSGELPSLGILDVLKSVGRTLPTMIFPGRAPSPDMLADPLLSAGGDVLKNAVESPRTIPAMLKGGVVGSAEGASLLTSPVDLALMAAGGVGKGARAVLTPALAGVRDAELAITAARAGGRFAEIPELVKQLNTARQAAGRATALVQGVRAAEIGAGGALTARGAERVLKADSGQDAALGVGQAAMGLMGMKFASPSVSGRTVPPAIERLSLPPAAVRVTPDGAALLPGADLPVPPPVSRVVTPEGPMARPAAVVGRGPNGPIYSGDPNAVPANLEPRALLPERSASGSELVSLPNGAIARRADVVAGESLLPSAARQSTEAPAPVTRARGGRRATDAPSTIPAAVVDFTPDGRKVYSSDPSASSVRAVPLDNLEVGEVRRMLAEMQSMPFTPHTFNDVPIGRGGSLEIVPGGAGASVFEDIKSLHGGGNPSRADVIAALEKTLSGDPSTYGPAIRETARLRLKGQLRGQLPPDAGDLPQSGGMDDTDFTEFDRFVSRLVGEGEGPGGILREPGQEGAASPVLLAHTGGGLAGAAYGAATGEDTADRVKRAAVFGVLGAAAPSLVRLRGAQGVIRGRVLNREPVMGRIVAKDTVDGVSSFPTTGRAPGQPATAMADPLKGIDPFLDKFPEEVRAGVRQVMEDNGGFAAQRRGTINREDSARLAEGVAVDLSRRLKPGQTLNAEGVRAYADTLTTVQHKIQGLASKVTAGQATDADLVALETARAEMKTVAASIMGARSEIGRALGEFNVLNRVLQSGNPNLIRDAATRLRGEAAQFAQAFGQQPADPMARYGWLKTQLRPSVGEKFRQYYYSSILSGLKTHERNILGNAANAIGNVVAQPFGVGADLVRSKLAGTPRSMYFSELPSTVAGTLAGIPRGISEALYSLKNGVNRSALTQALSAAEAGKLDVPRIEFGGGGANPINWPGRALDGADQFFRSVARNQELYALAHAQAKREGLTGARLEDRMAALVSGTDEVSTRLQQQADAYARRAVFQEKPGKIATSIQLFSAQHPWFSFVVPFVKTPANILRQGLEASPAGFGMAASRAGGREGAQAIGRAAMGTTALSYLAYLAATGRLSGSGPNDPIARAQLMESGWRPNSVKIGDKWVGYSLFQPVSVPASIVANAFEQWRDSGAKADTVSKVGGAVLKSARSFLDQSFLSGLADMVEAVEGFNLKSAARVIGNTAQSLTPFSGAQRTVRDAVDPMVRQPEGIAENVAAKIPGLSQNVPARLDRFGRDVQREGGGLQRAADPFNTSTETTDPIVRELGRLGVRMGMPGGSLNLPGGMELSREQSRALQVTKGTVTYNVLNAIINSPVYQELSDDKKADVIDKAITRARSKAGAAVKKQTITGVLRLAR